MECVMADLKSKLPDLNEVSSMAGKLFGDIKKSITEIVDSYKKKHDADCTDSACKTEAPAKKTTAKKTDKAE